MKKLKQLLLAGTTFLAIAVSHSAANAAPIVFDFTYTGSLVRFMVPTTDQYQILTFGAQGGNGRALTSLQVSQGGQGAEIGGNFSLTAGETLQIAVGGAGMSTGLVGGGGGGSFVVGPGNSPLVIAGGGGGGGGSVLGPSGGQGGLTGPDGGGIPAAAGGTDGNGGGAGTGCGGCGGGGGFFSPGGGGSAGGGAFPDLTGGLVGGGFGGGGGAGSNGAGGGGGYSGGGGGVGGPLAAGSGFGGGSFDTGTDQILMADFHTGNGEVMITELAAAVPEPASIVLLGVGLLSLTVMTQLRLRS
jgi:hypothetical protein